MKPFLTCLMMIAAHFSLIAQAYQPMAIEGAHWFVYVCGDAGGDCHVSFIEGDRVSITGLLPGIYVCNIETATGFFSKKIWIGQ